MSREVVITGVGAVTPLGVGARTLHERWSAGAVRHRGRRGRAPRVRAHRPPLDQGGPPRRPLHAVRDRRRATRRSPRPAGSDELPYDADRDRLRSSAPASAASARSSDNHDAAARVAAPKTVSPLVGAADDGQRRAGRAVDAPRPARPVLRRRLGLRGGRARDRHRRAHDPVAATPTRSSPAAPRRR